MYAVLVHPEPEPPGARERGARAAPRRALGTARLPSAGAVAPSAPGAAAAGNDDDEPPQWSLTGTTPARGLHRYFWLQKLPGRRRPRSRRRCRHRRWPAKRGDRGDDAVAIRALGSEPTGSCGS